MTKELMFTSIVVFWTLVLVIGSGLGVIMGSNIVTNVQLQESHSINFFDYLGFLWGLMTFQVYAGYQFLSIFFWIFNLSAAFIVLLVLRGN